MQEIFKPLEVIDQLFARCSDPFDAGALPPREWQEKAHFVRVLKLHDEDNFQHVPCLNEVELVESIRHQSLVRYRCMVQDVLETELYPSLLLQKDSKGTAKIVTTKYRDISQEMVTSHCNLGRQGIGSRGVYHCVPMPGETLWASPLAGRLTSTKCTVKRETPSDVPTQPTPKQRRRGEHGNKIEDRTPTTPLEAPSLKSGASISCVVKLYDADEEILKVCETVEILGVFCTQFSVGEVPQLHGLFVRKLPFFHPMLPFSPRWLSEGRLVCTLHRRFVPSVVLQLRTLAIKSLQKCLAGDEIAAEYVLALLVARVYGHNGNRFLGRWSLNISQWPEGLSVSLLVEAISNLLPRVVHFTVTPHSLCTMPWKPQKDFEANRVQSGQLQLAPGTLVIFDETTMEAEAGSPGLDESGRRAMRAIQALDSEQMLLIDFDRYEVQIPLEVNCLYISKSPSILRSADIQLPLRPQSCPVVPEPSTGSIEAVRLLLGIIAHRTQPLRLQQIMGAFSQDFAHLRDEFRDMDLGQETLHVWVALARACCYTHGEDEMTLQRWRMVSLFERERCKRCTCEGTLP